LVFYADVSVLHRHLDVGVPGKRSRLYKRRSVAEQFGDVRVATGGVEIGDPFGGNWIFLRDGFEVGRFGSV
jgi:hypothetical protein